MTSQPSVYVIGGPNGSGKSTLAPFLLRDKLHLANFINADTIASGLSAFEPDQVQIEAGRIGLNRLEHLATQHQSFAFESTLASRTYARRISQWKTTGYAFHLIFLWLQSGELAIERVAIRVKLGGHSIPEETIRRRYARGIQNFHHLYTPLANSWSVIDNSDPGQAVLIAQGESTLSLMVYQNKLWKSFCEMSQ